jgi:hypothetical protein
VEIEEASARTARAHSEPLLSQTRTTNEAAASPRATPHDREISPIRPETDNLIPPQTLHGRSYASIQRPTFTSSEDDDTLIHSEVSSSNSRQLTSPESPQLRPRISIPADLSRSTGYSIDAYRQLLEFVIQKSNRSTLPFRDPVNNVDELIDDPSFYDGYDHDAVFGIRAEDEWGHNSKLGAAGELYVGEICNRD